jgi:Serine carboxypeptidase S28
MTVLPLVVAFGLLSTATASSLSSSAQGINTWLRGAHSGGKTGEQTFLPLLSTQTEFPELFFSQPLDHFSESLGITFGQRYWVNARHYVKGGPVIVLDGGETSGEGVHLP